MSKRTPDNQQGTFFQPSHYGDEIIVGQDRQFPEPVRLSVEILDEAGLPINYTEPSAEVQERNVKLVAVLNRLAEAGSFNALVKAGYLDPSDEHHGQFERRYGKSAPYRRKNAVKSRDRLTNQARIIFARAGGYITPEQESEYLSLYPDKTPERRKGQQLPKPPKEPPFPEDVKPDIDREFRKFRRRFAVPERDGADNAHHKANVTRHAKARNTYLGQLQNYLELVLKSDADKHTHI